MKKLFTQLFSLLIATTAVSTTALANDTDTGTKLFESNTSSVSTSNPTHRIPAIVKVKNKTLVAISDERYSTNGGDIGTGRIDLVYKVSTDNGVTWSEKETIISGSGNTGYGDAAVVADRETGKILIMCASGSTSYGNSSASNSNGTVNVNNAIHISKITGEMADDGTITWSSATDMSSSIYGLYTYTSSDNGGLGRPGQTSYNIYVTKAFFGSGRICQSTIVKNGASASYRLYAALTTNRGSLVIYSDDFGTTWKTLGDASAQPASGGDEAKIEELPNGDVLLCAKQLSNSGRIFNIYHWTDITATTGSWGSAGTLNDSSVPAARCNGEIFFVRATNASTGADCYVALMSAPADQNNRQNVTIYYKGINSKADCNAVSQFSTASEWDGSYKVSTTSSAYSTMQQTADGDIAFLYEENNYAHSNVEAYDIVYKTIPLSTITNNAYTSDDPWENKIVTLKVKVKNASTTKYYFVHNKSQASTKGEVDFEVVDVDDAPETLDPSYYWVISKAPKNGDNYDRYYYMSSYQGNGYIGTVLALNTSTNVYERNGIGCSNDYNYEFKFRDFVKESVIQNGKSTSVIDTMEGVALNFIHTTDANKNKYVAISEDGQPGWYDHTTDGEYHSSWQNYWSTDFIMTEVERLNPEQVTEKGYSYGTKDAPTEYGFKVTFTRHDNSYQVKEQEDYHYYATLKLPFAVSLPKNITAYSITDKQPSSTKDDRYFVGLTELSLAKSAYADGNTNDANDENRANVLPRETPVLLMLKNEDAGEDGKTAGGDITKDVYFSVTKAAEIQSTGFKGTLGTYTFDSTDSEYPTDGKQFFVLSKKSGRVAFRYITNSKVNANKAYYVYDGTTASAKELSFVFIDNDSETTGVDRYITIDTDKSDAPIYDLMGRRVVNPTQKGIYIQNGKKFLIK